MFATEQAEAGFIATEIKRLIAHSGGMLGWNDFVILCERNRVHQFAYRHRRNLCSAVQCVVAGYGDGAPK